MCQYRLEKHFRTWGVRKDTEKTLWLLQNRAPIIEKESNSWKCMCLISSTTSRLVRDETVSHNFRPNTVPPGPISTRTPTKPSLIVQSITDAVIHGRKTSFLPSYRSGDCAIRHVACLHLNKLLSIAYRLNISTISEVISSHSHFNGSIFAAAADFIE